MAGKAVATQLAARPSLRAVPSPKSGLETLYGIHRHPKNLQVADLREARSFCL